MQKIPPKAFKVLSQKFPVTVAIKRLTELNQLSFSLIIPDSFKNFLIHTVANNTKFYIVPKTEIPLRSVVSNVSTACPNLATYLVSVFSFTILFSLGENCKVKRQNYVMVLFYNKYLSISFWVQKQITGISHYSPHV